MARHRENAAFVCVHCGLDVEPLANGSYRNHCPACLWSLHVDELRPGDRASACHGPMEPVGCRRKKGKGWQIVHRCTRCGKRQPNRVAEGTRQPDAIDQVIELVRREGGGPKGRRRT